MPKKIVQDKQQWTNMKGFSVHCLGCGSKSPRIEMPFPLCPNCEQHNESVKMYLNEFIHGMISAHHCDHDDDDDEEHKHLTN